MDAIILQILNGLDKGSAYALIALGLTLIFGTLAIYLLHQDRYEQIANGVRGQYRHVKLAVYLGHPTQAVAT